MLVKVITESGDRTISCDNIEKEIVSTGHDGKPTEVIVTFGYRFRFPQDASRYYVMNDHREKAGRTLDGFRIQHEGD